MSRIAIAGKGGSGKTTISGTLARLAGQKLGEVLAIDGDPNPNLATTLGIARDEPWPLLSRDLLVHEDIDGQHTVRLAHPMAEIVARHAVEGPDGVHLLALGEVESAGKG